MPDSINISVISDLHLGADSSVLIDNRNSTTTANMTNFKNAVIKDLPGGKVDYLVLLGDVFDLSVTSFKNSWITAGIFLNSIEDITDNIVYVPGNHDFTMWHYLEQDINVTNKIRSGSLPSGFRYTAPGIMNSSIKKDKNNNKLGPCFIYDVSPPYDGGYFKSLWKGENKQFFVAYPNLYIFSSADDVALLTHGQYFDTFWSILGFLCLNCADKYLKNAVNGELTISEFVQVNYPLSILDASAIGQSGIFADLAQQLTEDVAKGDLSKIKDIKKRILKVIDKKIEFKGNFSWIKEYLSDKTIDLGEYIADKIIEDLSKKKGTRFNENYIKEHTDDIKEYLVMSDRELSEIKKSLSSDSAPNNISRLIFGHTHVSSRPGEQSKIRFASSAQPTSCLNTGGWILNSSGSFNAAVANFKAGKWTMTQIDADGIGDTFDI